MEYEKITKNICDYALRVLKADKIHFQPMQRKNNRVNTKRGFVIGRTNLKTGLITIDIWTPKQRKPKKISSILRTLCHEVAHHQKKPFRQRYKGRWIIRQHYPEFYEQVNKNILILKNCEELKRYFK
jgi:hypothetical protein